MKDTSKRQKWLHLRVTDEEYSKLQNAYKGTICRKFSEYLRNVLFRQPITVYYRNRTADEFLTVAVQLKNEMTRIGRNFNQVVKKINISWDAEELALYLFDVQMAQKEVDEKVTEICQKMDQLYALLKAEEGRIGGMNIKPEYPAFTYAAAADQQENKSGQQ